MSQTDLLNEITTILTSRDWSKEVRFNALREFGRGLVFFQNPRFASEYDKLHQMELLMPKGLMAIKQILESQSNDDYKVTEIKRVLKERGYEENIEGKSLLRTENTHQAYKNIVQLIAAFDKSEEHITFSTFI